MAAFVFLDANGVELTASEEAFEAMVMAVANGSMSKAHIADWFRANCTGRLSLN